MWGNTVTMPYSKIRIVAMSAMTLCLMNLIVPAAWCVAAVNLSQQPWRLLWME
jgi:hypothetical protein